MQVTRYFLIFKWIIISNVDRQDYSCKECWGPLNIFTENQYHLALEYVQKHVECGVLDLKNGYFLENHAACAASHTTCARTDLMRSWVCSRLFTGDVGCLGDEENSRVPEHIELWKIFGFIIFWNK